MTQTSLVISGGTVDQQGTGSIIYRPVPGSAATYSTHRFLHERTDPYLVGGGQLLQRKGDRPHGSIIEVRFVAETERCVSRLELVRTLKEVDDITVLGVR